MPPLLTDWRTYDHYGLALIALLGTFAAALAIQWLIQYSRWAGRLQALQGVAPPFINIIGVLFGVTLAFLANDTWSAHDRATGAVYREADALRSLAALSEGLPAPLQGQLRRAIVDYAELSTAEWPALAQRHEDPRVNARADALLALLAAPATGAEAGATVQALMLRLASTIRTEHDLRIALSQTHVNPLKWLGMAFLGFITLLSVAVVHIERPRAALVAVTLFSLAAAPTAAIVLIQGNPFQPPAAVSPAPIGAVVQALR